MKTLFSRFGLLMLMRVMLGFTFLWAFLDKTFGLGFATETAKAWINGGSPTTGFLTHAVTGPFAGFFQSLSGSAFVDWMFMLGLLVVGITLLANKYVWWGCMIGIVMLLLMYFALLFPPNNPIIDDHLIYAVLLGYIAITSKHHYRT